MMKRMVAALLLCCMVTTGLSTAASAAGHTHIYRNGVCTVCGARK